MLSTFSIFVNVNLGSVVVNVYSVTFLSNVGLKVEPATTIFANLASVFFNLVTLIW